MFLKQIKQREPLGREANELHNVKIKSIAFRIRTQEFVISFRLRFRLCARQEHTVL